MARTIQLSIPAACHEDWHTMKPDEKGRYCTSCRKNVTDFTNMSDREILEHISRASGNVCGRLHTDQLNRTMSLRKEMRMPWLKYFFRFTLPAFFISAKAEAQENKKPVIEQTANQKQQSKCKVGEPVDIAMAIRGKVIDGDYAVAGASVIIKGSSTGTVTDIEGNFRIEMPAGNAATLFISALGYETLEIAMTPSADTSQPIIRISPVQQVLGEIVIVGAIHYIPTPRRSPLEIARSIITPDSVRVFPNPVALGNNIDMALKVNQPGNYYVEVTDFSGRLMMKKEVRVNAKVFQSSIPTKQFLTGRYIVCVRNSEGKKIAVKKIIVQ